MKFTPPFLLIMLGCCCSVRAGDAPPQRGDMQELTAVYLIMDGESTAQTALRLKSLPDKRAMATAVRNRAAQIKARQTELEARLAEKGIQADGRFYRLANALRVHVPPNRIDELRNLPGVAQIQIVPRHQRLTASSVPFIGAPSVWSGVSLIGTNADGMGIRIGIIDTGIDYLHADFGGSGNPQHYTNNNSAIIEPGSFPTAKVAGGYDFAGDAYTGSNSPVGDPDPLDCAQTGHGTHVAGIAAGVGVLTNGTAYTGAYTQGMDFAQFRIGPGVAPHAKLYAIKIFGCSGNTQLLMSGLEWAADPNDDGDFSDRLDVVNLSVGAAFGFAGPGDAEQEAVNELVDLGCIVVAGSGNNGNVLYNVFSPSVAEKCISVGNSIDGGFNPAVEVQSPPSFAGLYEAVEGRFTRLLAVSGTLTGRVVYARPNLACDTLMNASELNGSIALIDRGTCAFVGKIRRAQNAGAIAVITVNNAPGSPVAMTGDALDIVIPGLMISQSDGDILKQALASNLVVRIGPDVLYPRSLADRLDTSSSRGPASPGNALKPEIVAPGNNITSAQAGSGTNTLTIGGTSMATPHVSGAAALMRQLHPEWPVEDIKAALMNTTRATRDGYGTLYPESWTGAGRVQVDRAVQASVVAKAEHSAGLVGLSFGSLTLTNFYTEVRRVLLTNHSANSATFSASVSNTVSENGFVLVPLTNTVTVPAGGSALVPVQLTADPVLFERTPDLVSSPLINGLPRNFIYEASGQIWFQNTNGSIHLPYYCNLRAGSSLHLVSTNVGTPSTSNTVSVTVPLAGTSAHPNPLVAAFQLGLISPNQNFTDPWRATGDLLAIGAASDAPSQSQFTNSSVYFGIATANNWTTPQSFVAQFDVLIDVNRDGIDDYRAFNSTLGNSTNNSAVPNAANDAFLSVVQNLSSGVFFTNVFLNVFPPDVRDTAPFNNSVMVITAPVRLLGLTTGNSRFNYRVRTLAPRERSSQVIETTPYVLFDPYRPVLDTTSGGIQRSPFHPDGQPVRVNLDRTAAIAHGFSSANTPGLLLLHHFNQLNQRVEIAFIELAAIQITSVAVSGSDVRVSFATTAGKRYRLERNSDVIADAWFTVVDNVTGTGGILQLSDTMGALQPKRFYRVRLIP